MRDVSLILLISVLTSFGGGQDEECEMCGARRSFLFSQEALADHVLIRKLGQESMPLFRHYSGHEAWPRLQLGLSRPGQVARSTRRPPCWASSSLFLLLLVPPPSCWASSFLFLLLLVVPPPCFCSFSFFARPLAARAGST